MLEDMARVPTLYPVVAGLACPYAWPLCERAPLNWAMTQNNLGNASRALGEREAGKARLEETVAAYRAALDVFEQANATHYVALTRNNLSGVEHLLEERRRGGAAQDTSPR